MKNITKKLFISILTAVFAFVTLGATTFAWFTVSNDTKISKFGGSVIGGQGFEISVSLIDYSEQIATAELNAKTTYINGLSGGSVNDYDAADGDTGKAQYLVEHRGTALELKAAVDAARTNVMDNQLHWYAGTFNIEDAITGLNNFKFNAVSYFSNPESAVATPKGLYKLDLSQTTQRSSQPAVIFDGTNAALASYLKFYVYFRTDNTTINGQKVYLNLNDPEMVDGVSVKKTRLESTNLTSWTCDVEESSTEKFKTNKGDELTRGSVYQYKIEDCARVGLNDIGAATPIVLENAASASSLTGDNPTGYVGNTEGVQTNTGDTAQGAIRYFTLKTGLSPLSANFNALASSNKLSMAAATNVAVTTLPRTYISGSTTYNWDIVPVTIWIEGWDGECMNAVFGQKLQVSLAFKFAA